MVHPIFDNDYKVTSVSRSENMDQEWYDYVISNTINIITGSRQGTLKQVNQHAEEYSQQLNERLRHNTSYYKKTTQKATPAKK